MRPKEHVFVWFLLLIAMACVIAISNYLVQFLLNDWLTLAAFTYPIAFLITDLTNRIFGSPWARLVVLYGFIIGVALSFFTADIRIALASGTAFLVSQLLDVQVFQKFRHSQWWQAPVFSSTIGSCVDTFLFFSIAFVATGVPWLTLAFGDLLAKAIMLLLLLLPYKWLSLMLANKTHPSLPGEV